MHPGVKKCHTVVNFWSRLEFSFRFWASGCEKVPYCRQVLVAIAAFAWVSLILVSKNEPGKISLPLRPLSSSSPTLSSPISLSTLPFRPLFAFIRFVLCCVVLLSLCCCVVCCCVVVWCVVRSVSSCLVFVFRPSCFLFVCCLVSVRGFRVRVRV